MANGQAGGKAYCIVRRAVWTLSKLEQVECVRYLVYGHLCCQVLVKCFQITKHGSGCVHLEGLCHHHRPVTGAVSLVKNFYDQEGTFSFHLVLLQHIYSWKCDNMF